jgi:hypothetical protein
LTGSHANTRSQRLVAGFRANIAVKRPLLESLFNIIPVARAKNEALSPEIASWFDSMEETRRAFDEPERKQKIWEMGANYSLANDTASAIVLLIYSELDRLHRATDVSLFERGAFTYVPGIRFSRAVYALANQVKHLGRWKREADAGRDERAILAQLVDDPLRVDASAEFLKRGYETYDALEAAVISCGDGIATEGIIPAEGRAGVPRITMRPGGTT